MIRINKDFVFEQTGKNTFHLIRETYPRYEKEITIKPTALKDEDDEQIESEYISGKCEDLDYAAKVYCNNFLPERSESWACEEKICFAMMNNHLEQLKKLTEQEQMDYFWNLSYKWVDELETRAVVPDKPIIFD